MGRVRYSGALVALSLVLVFVFVGCGGGSGTSSSTSASNSSTTSTGSSSSTTSSGASKTAKPAISMMTLSSPAFKKAGKIPTRYTCDGADESPPLQWAKVPSGTSQLLLFVLDLAGGPKGAVRWAVGDISPSATSFAANSIPSGAVRGLNSLGKAEWAGICPDKGKPHNYVFLLYALRKKLNLANGFDTKTIQGGLSGNTAGAGLLFGTYQRS